VISDVLLTRSGPAPGRGAPRVLTTLRLASWYAWVTIIPYPGQPLAVGAGRDLGHRPAFLVAAAGLVPLIAAAVAAAVWSRVSLFFIAWFWITLAPSIALNLLPGSTPIVADRFLYLPSVGGCVLLALWVRRLIGEVHDIEAEHVRKAPAIALAGLVVLFAILTIWRNEYWKDDLLRL